MRDLRARLRQVLHGRVCLMGVGNVDYGDDGFGVRLAEALQASGIPDVVVAGNTPERWVGRVADDGVRGVVFLDAVDFGSAPGSLLLLEGEEIAARFPQLSTHKMSLGLLAKVIESNGTMRAWLLGVQPASLKPATSLSPAMQTTLDAVCDMFRGAMLGRHAAVSPEGHGR